MSTIFKDTAGTEWNCTITVGALRRVLAETQIDLTKLFEDEKAEAVRKLLASPLTIADVVFAVVRPTAEQRNITAEQFGELLAGQNMADAADSLLEALEVFFSGQDVNMGASFQKFLDGYRRGRSTVWNRARQEVELLDPEKVANEAFEKALQKRRAALTSGFASGD